MTSRNALFLLLVAMPRIAAAQTRVDIHVAPMTVSVNTQGVTTAVLSFNWQLTSLPATSSYVPAEGLWCGRLVASHCDPATIYGQAPGIASSPLIGSSSPGALSFGSFTEVMTVPASVAQRAYDAARAGQPSRFYYVRRFVSLAAATYPAPDLYVSVICQLGAGGANAPFALTNVRVHLVSETPVLFVARGDTPPALQAEIAYTGTGRLRGRWEIVLPGEPPPTPADLMTEGSLAPWQRGLQRRYQEIERFNVLLLPTGRFTLPGPDPARLPTQVDGSYTILLRIEASDDGFGDTQIASGLGAPAIVHNGASAAFPMPTLRYIVGGSRTRAAMSQVPQNVRLQLPFADALVAPDSALTLRWIVDRAAARYRVEIERVVDGANLLSAIVVGGAYDVPPFVLAKVADGAVRWHVMALDAGGNAIGRSEWRRAKRRQASP